ncbi:MAG: helix-turn-helix transcriptional regulator [Eubacterium sp.]|nr:helix-turn-helix transcriptional regulator [Eubacterium sp.]
MAEIFEYSDRLNSPVEAFYCSSDGLRLPVAAHWHYFVEMLYMLEGSVTVICNGVPYKLTPGKLLLIPPQVVHSITHDNNHSFLYTCIKYSASHIRLVEGYLPNLHILFQKLMQREVPPLLFSAEEFFYQTSDNLSTDRLSPINNTVCNLMKDIINEVEQRPYGYLTLIFSRLTALILEILRLWYNCGIPLQTELPTETDTYSIQDVAIYIDKHSSEDLKVDDLAGMCNMSYSYFAKVFHRQYGQSCKQYIEFIRLTKAENLLLFTNYDLNTIAEETGFSDSSHLIRCFRRLYHITPKQYRLQHLSDA